MARALLLLIIAGVTARVCWMAIAGRIRMRDETYVGRDANPLAFWLMILAAAAVLGLGYWGLVR